MNVTDTVRDSLTGFVGIIEQIEDVETADITRQETRRRALVRKPNEPESGGWFDVRRLTLVEQA